MAGVSGEDSWEDSKEVNQSILKKINPEYSLKGLMRKLKFQYFGHVMWRDNSLEKTLILGKIEGRRRKGWGWDTWMAFLTQWAWVCANSGKYWRTGRPGMLQFMGLQRIGHNLVSEQQQQPRENNGPVGYQKDCSYRKEWTDRGFPSHSQFM